MIGSNTDTETNILKPISTGAPNETTSNWFMSFVTTIATGIKNTIVYIYEGIKNAIVYTYEGIKNAIVYIYEGIKNSATYIGNLIWAKPTPTNAGNYNPVTSEGIGNPEDENKKPTVPETPTFPKDEDTKSADEVGIEKPDSPTESPSF